MDMIGYRYVLMENIIQECLQRIRNGETEFELDMGDLTDLEVEYVREQIEKRL